MRVAIVRSRRAVNNPDIYMRNTLIIAQAYGIETFLCTLDDFDYDQQRVTGRSFERGVWYTKQFEFPDAIDNLMVQKSTAPALAKLSKYALLMNHRVGSRESIYPFLQNDPAFKPYFIPTINLENKQQIIDSLAKYHAIVIKPGNGMQARGIIKIYQEKDVFKVDMMKAAGEQVQRLNEEAFSRFIDTIDLSQSVCQPLIDTTTKDGHPFHVRMLVRKNEVGRFSLVSSYVEIGLLNKVVSNMHIGGGLIWLEALVTGLYQEKAPAILQELKKMSQTLPRAFQAHYDYHLSALGIDIALDKQGHPWIMEVNAGPGHEYVKLDDIELRVRNYAFLAGKAEAAKKFGNRQVFQVAGDIRKRL